jgi:aspartate/methionine/tyrosine aminotransferase
MVLRNKDFCTTVNSVLDFSRIAKEEQLKDEVQLIQDILTGSKNAITQSMIDAAIHQKIKTEDALIASIIEEIRNRALMVEYLSDKSFQTKWLFRNSLRV